MALSWTEIKDRALRFANEWKDESSEDAEAKSFWDDFFNVFGIIRRRVAQFEKAVPRTGRGAGFIDLFWPGTLVVEHKSRGRDLDRAVDLCYRPQTFPSETKRIEYLFELYKQYTTPLIGAGMETGGRKKKRVGV
ncbi:hypothetical protein GCM10027578_05420 [Spirosoma luteolum]